MKLFNSLKYLILLVPMLFTVQAMAEDLPIVMKISHGKLPPVHSENYITIGYWDVDDFKGNKGNNGTGLGTRFASRGTYVPDDRYSRPGTYMTSMGIDRKLLGSITSLSTTVSNKSVVNVWNKLKRASTDKKVLYKSSSKVEYLVGIWDVDGGGGYGSDGSFGKYAMTLHAKFSKERSDRKLEDLILLASNKKGPTSKPGYVVIGYWDVDSGGSQGTDGSTGKYMMTLLAKWSN